MNSNRFHLVFLEGPETTTFPTTREAGNRCDVYPPPASLQNNFAHVPPSIPLIFMPSTPLQSDPLAAPCRSMSSL